MSHASAVQITTLPNGAGVALRPMPQAQSVAVAVWVRAGGRYETEALSGISHFVEHLLFKGTRRRSCEALKQRIEGVGGSLNGFTAEEFTCYMAKVPAQHARRALDVLADMVREPNMSPSDIEKERDVIIEEIRMYEDAPGQSVFDLFSQLLWPDHPLGMLLSGTIDTVRRIKRDDLIDYWQRMYQPKNLLVTAAGRLETEPFVQDARQYFGAMRGKTASKFLRAPRPRRASQVRVWNKATEQTHLCLGTYAIPRTHPDRFALELLHVLLGANMSSRLFREVREKRGLVYEIGTQIKRFDDTGVFVVHAGCEPGRLVATVETVLAELGRIRRQSVAAAELKRAKDYYAGQLQMGLEDTMDHMLWMGEQVVTVGKAWPVDRLLEHIAKVTARDIQRVARALFVAPQVHLVVVGPVGEPETAKLNALCKGL